MQACQLCGAKSWGPLRVFNELPQKANTFLRLEHALYVVCDVCGACAAGALVDGEDAHFSQVKDCMGVVPGLGFNPLELGSSLMKSFLPQKDAETRAERLVRAMLSCELNWTAAPSLLAKRFVDLARALEAELDTDDARIELKPRDFRHDFLIPVTNGLPDELQKRVTLACDCAIAYGALEAQDGNASLRLSQALEDAYFEKVKCLKDRVY